MATARIDETDFVDTEFEESAFRVEEPAEETLSRAEPETAAAASVPSRKDLEERVSDTHLRLEELRRRQQELEERRAALEEARWRRKEYHDGKQEMQEHLVRGIEILQDSSESLQRDAVEMERTLGEFRQALEKLGSFSEDSWTAETVEVELTRALTVIENARMEWNGACLKWPALKGRTDDGKEGDVPGGFPTLLRLPFLSLCRLGFGLVWPLAVVNLLGWIVSWWIS